MSFIDLKYINLVSGKLLKFSKKKENLYTFRCPYCGDSSKNRNKTRGYFYRVRSDFFFKCHNCSVGRTLGNFLKDNDQLLYDEYVMERYKEGLTGKGTNTPTPKFEIEKPKFRKNIFSGLEKISDLNTSHPAKTYLKNRSIPESYLSKLYFVEDFNAWAKLNNKIKESRIIIPFFSAEREVYGYQGRALNPHSKLRYITTVIDPIYPKVFGLDDVDVNKTIYVLEGPFDSMFVENSIAMAGSDIDISSILGENKDVVFVYDNEPRNPQIVKRMESVVEKYPIVVWPTSITQKDVNDMVLAGVDVNEVISKNTFSGIEAKVKLNNWKRV